MADLRYNDVMDSQSKHDRYERIAAQLQELFIKTADPTARMATTAALLKGKMEHFFWCGFYRLVDGDLTVGPYQGSLACLVLRKGTGVCWAVTNCGRTLRVDDVHQFPGHIACDSRSRSEVVVPLRNAAGEVAAVLDVDSDRLAAFDEGDERGLERIADLIGPV